MQVIYVLQKHIHLSQQMDYPDINENKVITDLKVHRQRFYELQEK